MAAFDLLIPTVGNDKFANMYTKYNDTITALKAGTTSQVLASPGAGLAPVMTSVWEPWITVGSGGGAPAFVAGFTGISLRYRRSLILDTVEVSGRFSKSVSALADGSSASVFVFPVGFAPSVPGISGSRTEISFKSAPVIISSDMIIVNNTGSSIAVGKFFDVMFRFPIS